VENGAISFMANAPTDYLDKKHAIRTELVSFLADTDGKKLELWQKMRDDQLDPIAKMLQGWHRLTEALNIPVFASETVVFNKIPI
jgi:hypothetical protein